MTLGPFQINSNLLIFLVNRDINTCQIPTFCEYYMKLRIYLKYMFYSLQKVLCNL